MSKIADVIELKSGYANFVDLKGAFETAQENADRMAMYRPTRAHRQAFEGVPEYVHKAGISEVWDTRIRICH